jgi:hypothetical protein
MMLRSVTTAWREKLLWPKKWDVTASPEVDE